MYGGEYYEMNPRSASFYTDMKRYAEPPRNTNYAQLLRDRVSDRPYNTPVISHGIEKDYPKDNVQGFNGGSAIEEIHENIRLNRIENNIRTIIFLLYIILVVVVITAIISFSFLSAKIISNLSIV
jgi:hypothetical protein